MAYVFEMIDDKMYIRLQPVASTVKEVERDDGSIVKLELPEKHSEDTRIGKVVAVGPDAADKGFDAGDTVVVSFMAGLILHFPADNITDDTHRIIGYREVACKIIDEEEIVDAEVEEEKK